MCTWFWSFHFHLIIVFDVNNVNRSESFRGGGGGNGMRRSLDQLRSLTLCSEFLNWLQGPNLIQFIIRNVQRSFSINTFRFPLGQVKENLVSFHQAYTFYLKMPLVKSKFSFIISTVIPFLHTHTYNCHSISTIHFIVSLSKCHLHRLSVWIIFGRTTIPLMRSRN